MSKFYIYAHKTIHGEVFYVGKGSGERMYITSNRNNYWKNIASKYLYHPIFLERELAEQEAYDKEIKWISYFKNKGQCRANFSLGGDGVRVEKRWWGAAISKGLQGRKVPRGEASASYKNFITKQQLRDDYCSGGLSSIKIGQKYGLSYATIIQRLRKYGLLVSGAGKKVRAIRCKTDGALFPSINDAARYYNLYRENIRKVLNGQYKHTGGKVFEDVADNR